MERLTTFSLSEGSRAGDRPLGTDNYMSDSPRYLKVLELYDRPDNPMFVPETGNAPAYARYFFAALGHGAIGFSPFGIDYTGYSNSPLGAPRVSEEALTPFALNYRLVGPMDRVIAALAAEGKLASAVEEKDKPSQTLHLGAWEVVVSYGLGHFGPGGIHPEILSPSGVRSSASSVPDTQAVAGFFCRVDFRACAPGRESTVSSCAWKKGPTRERRSGRHGSGTATRRIRG